MSRILIVDDEVGVCDFLSIFLKKEGHETKSANNYEEAMSIFREWNPNIALVDLRMPEVDGLDLIAKFKKENKEIITIIITAYASFESAVEAMRRGAFDYITKPFKLDEIKLVINRAIEVQKLKEENRELREKIEKLSYEEIIGESEQIKEINKIIEKIANVDSNVLIIGESGTGKELVARKIHRISKRRDKPFIPVNCGAMPESLLESELFGYKKGAFTGANKDKDGLFKAADGGTLFLDEIGSATQKVQIDLLRAIEQKEIMPIGANQPIPVDVRIISATNQNLELLVKNGDFREDLYYRLNVIQIYIPPLRERKKDIPILTKYFIKKYCNKYNISEKRINESAIQLLLSYNWPGNVRELENVLERAVILTEGDEINVDAFPDKIKESSFIKRSREEEIIAYIKSESKINTKTISKMFGISQRMARNEIEKLLKKGIVVKMGSSKKNTYYVLK